jgi:hypothetical protein
MIPALRDVSLIWLLCPGLLCLLVPIAVMGGLAFVTRKGRLALPSKFQAAQRGLRKVDAIVDKAGEKVAAPFVAAETRSANLKARANYVRRRFGKG